MSDELQNAEHPYPEYKGFRQEISNGQVITTETYIGFKPAIDDLSDSYAIRSVSDKGYGSLEKKTISQADGAFWRLELSWNKDTLNSIHIGAGTSYGPTDSVLTTTMMQREIENHPKYHKRWNNNLYVNATLVPVIDQQALLDILDAWNNGVYENDHISAADKYKYGWAVSPSDLPAEDLNQAKCNWIIPTATIDGKSRKLVMTNPGVSYYEYPTWTLTELAKCGSKNQTAWVVRGKAGKIAEPINGDFGFVQKYGRKLAMHRRRRQI